MKRFIHFLLSFVFLLLIYSCEDIDKLQTIYQQKEEAERIAKEAQKEVEIALMKAEVEKNAWKRIYNE